MKNYYEYLNFNSADLFTVICLPEESGKFPIVIRRDPYVDAVENSAEDEIVDAFAASVEKWVAHGYAVVYQHCRGRGKSSGDCIPYINEREDGLFLQDWVRQQSFYGGELYLVGNSYKSTVHQVTAPFADDIKGAVLAVQDTERYNCNYRNGFYKMGLHGGWYVKMYKHKSIREKAYKQETYNMLPLIDFSKTVFGESVPSFDDILLHPDRNDDFWNTRAGGNDSRGAMTNANIPILVVTGFYDIYTGGMFDLWNAIAPETKAKCALLVHPYDHSNNKSGDQPIVFEDAPSGAQVLDDVYLRWIDSVRGKDEAPIERGKVTYYKLFGNKWCTDDFAKPEKSLTFTLGEGEKTYTYNPYAPAKFKGGLSANFGGNAWQYKPKAQPDVISFFTPEFEEDTFVKGKMTAKLRVRSDCEDTCFYVRLSLVKEEGDYGLRDDINQISNFAPDYVPGEEIEMDFTFDEHAFVVKKGEKLRIDVSSSAFPLYVRHTNNRGPFALQTTAKIAHNTVICDKSSITIFVE